jgi:hypothetical protein
MPKMFDGTETPSTTAWQFYLRHSRMLVMLWSAKGELGATQRAKLAYGMQLGKPIRLLALAPTRLPEDLCVGYGDVQGAQVTDTTQMQRQVHAWLEEVKARG